MVKNPLKILFHGGGVVLGRVAGLNFHDQSAFLFPQRWQTCLFLVGKQLVLKEHLLKSSRKKMSRCDINSVHLRMPCIPPDWRTCGSNPYCSTYHMVVSNFSLFYC